MAVRPEESVELVSYASEAPAKVGAAQAQRAIRFTPLPGNTMGGLASLSPQYSHLVDCRMLPHAKGKPETLQVVFTGYTVVLTGLNLMTLLTRIEDHRERYVKQEELGAGGNQYVDLDKAVVTGMELMGPPE